MTVMSLKASFMSSNDYDTEEFEDEYEEEVSRKDALEEFNTLTEHFTCWMQEEPKLVSFIYKRTRTPDDLAWYVLTDEEQQKLYH